MPVVGQFWWCRHQSIGNWTEIKFHTGHCAVSDDSGLAVVYIVNCNPITQSPHHCYLRLSALSQNLYLQVSETTLISCINCQWRVRQLSNNLRVQSLHSLPWTTQHNSRYLHASRSRVGRTRWKPCLSVTWNLCRNSGRILLGYLKEKEIE